MEPPRREAPFVERGLRLPGRPVAFAVGLVAVAGLAASALAVTAREDRFGLTVSLTSLGAALLSTAFLANGLRWRRAAVFELRMEAHRFVDETLLVARLVEEPRPSDTGTQASTLLATGERLIGLLAAEGLLEQAEAVSDALATLKGAMAASGRRGLQ